MAPVIPDPRRIKSFRSEAAFAAWMEKNHARAPELWLKIHKKASGLPTVTTAEALDVVLCFGWIDGIRKSFDERSFLQRYTPRRAKSPWSQINRDHVARLTAAGRMTPHGQRQVDAAKADGRWDAAQAPMRNASAATVPTDLRAAIDANPRARTAFLTLGRPKLFALTVRTNDMKTPAGRAKKIAALVARLARGAFVLAFLAAAPVEPLLVTLSIVGTSDLHGVASPRNGAGGLPLLSGYVNNLRAARASDGGAVLLLDSGDTFQGDVESNLSEGALVVDAYNAMGYAAEAIGNHDFDFGSLDSPAARQLAGDPHGAIKARAAQARYPFLAANLIDEATGRLVEWPNVRPSVIVEAAGVKVGIVGVMTIDALQSTIAANIQGLRIAPLAPVIAEHAAKLRAGGADVVIVAAHAGGRCERFDRPDDLSSCEADAEIFRVARALPPGLVDVIAAGHTHGGLAHRVNGIVIVQALSRGQAFSRADILFDRRTRKVSRIRPFAPIELAAVAEYEGRPVAADPLIAKAMAPALERVRRLQATTLGPSLDEPILRGGESGSPLGHAFADAILAVSPGADAAIINAATRGLRADLPAGLLTFGRLYDVFPFDNRVARVSVSAGELRRWLIEEIQQGRRGALGISGLEASMACRSDGVLVALRRAGRSIQDDDRLQIATIASPTLSGSVAFAASNAAGRRDDDRVVREVVEDWFRKHPHPEISARGILGLPCVPF